MERETAILKHEMHEKIVQPFLIDAFKAGAHRIKPKHTQQHRWNRQIMIGVVYNDIGSTATLQELADKHGMFRHAVLAVNKTFLRNLWNNSPPEVKEKYSLNEVLAARKPWSQRSREKRSRAWRRISLKVEEQVERGVQI